MSDDKKSKVSDKASEIARNIWLAGLGAYGKAFDEAQDRVDKVGKDTPRLFKDLVAKGSKFEGDARESIEELRESHGSAVEARIRKVRENFNINKFGKDSDIEDIKTRLDELTSTVENLAAAVNAIVPAKKTRK